MKEIAIDTAALSRDITRLKEELKVLKNAEIKMADDVSELSTMWKGTANDAFLVQFLSDRQAFNELYTTMDGLVQALEHAREEYDACDEQVNTLVNSIRL